LDELIPIVNEAFQVETGNTGIGFKCADRIPTRDYAKLESESIFIKILEIFHLYIFRSLLPDLYVLRENGEIVGCVHSPVSRNQDGNPESVYVGMLTVKASHQV
jgi:hypothetical protein